MVNIFGDSTGKVGPVGPPGPAGIGGGLKEVIRWFPQMILEQTRKKLNVLTLLIETVPPAKMLMWSYHQKIRLSVGNHSTNIEIIP